MVRHRYFQPWASRSAVFPRMSFRRVVKRLVTSSDKRALPWRASSLACSLGFSVMVLVVKRSGTSLPRRGQRFESSHRFGNVATTGVAASERERSPAPIKAGGEEVCYFAKHRVVGSNPTGRRKPSVAQPG